jgi:hypothetical protein
MGVDYSIYFRPGICQAGHVRPFAVVDGVPRPCGVRVYRDGGDIPKPCGEDVFLLEGDEEEASYRLGGPEAVWVMRGLK